MVNLIEMAKRHQDQDMIKQGVWLDDVDGKGCSIGCFNHELGNESSDIAAFSKAAGIPEWMGHLQENIFEGLSVENSRDWHLECVTLYPGVKDWNKTRDLFLISLLERVKQYDQSNVVQSVIDLLRRKLNGEDVTAKLEKAAVAVRAAAYAAAAAAARAAARAADAADAADAAARAADAAAYAADAADARSDFYQQTRIDLVAALKTGVI